MVNRIVVSLMGRGCLVGLSSRIRLVVLFFLVRSACGSTFPVIHLNTEPSVKQYGKYRSSRGVVLGEQSCLGLVVSGVFSLASPPVGGFALSNQYDTNTKFVSRAERCHAR